MNNIVKKFENFNNNEYTIILKHVEKEFIEKDYKEGIVGETDPDSVIEQPYTNKFEDFSSLKNYLVEHYNLSSHWNEYIISENGEYIYTNRLIKKVDEVDYDDYKYPSATEEEIAAWKKGNIKLYNEKVSIKIEVIPNYSILNGSQIQNIIGGINLG